MNGKPIRLIIPARLLLTASVLFGRTIQQARAGTPVGTAFTYQGRLDNNGAPANGSFDFQFSLCDAPVAGTQIGSTTAQTIAVSDGLFTTSLDFGAGVFGGEARYLEIAVQYSGGSGFTTLTPRQGLAAVPYASFADRVQPIANVVVVAKSGGDYTTISAALAAITTASASNPYVIRVAPGVYLEPGGIDLKPYVDIEGSGEGVTILRAFGSDTDPSVDGSSATMRALGVTPAEVRFLTV